MIVNQCMQYLKSELCLGQNAEHPTLLLYLSHDYKDRGFHFLVDLFQDFVAYESQSKWNKL